MRTLTATLPLACYLWIVAALVGPPPAHPENAPGPASFTVPAASTPAGEVADAALLRGGVGPQHCALAVGIFLGGALGFWVNPFLGTGAMRLGLMAGALHCFV